MKLLKTRRSDAGADADTMSESPAEQPPMTNVDNEPEIDETSVAVEDSLADALPSRRDRRRTRWSAVAIYGALPALVLLLAVAAGFLKWQDGTARDAQEAAQESVRAATDGTVALLSYRPDTVQHDLEAARSRLTGDFLDAYTKLTHDVVIPGAQQKQISALATVPAATSTSATAAHAVVLVFVNQTTTIGTGTPSSTASTVRVTLDKVDNRWLISQFDPV